MVAFYDKYGSVGFGTFDGQQSESFFGFGQPKPENHPEQAYENDDDHLKHLYAIS